MKIVEIRAVQPPTPGSPADWRTQLGQIVVEVRTDSGLCGIGVGGGGVAGIHVIHTVLSDLLIGQDASNVEKLHAEMVRQTLFFGQKGLVVMAISGVDLALWDLRGKVAQKPVAQLLNDQVDMAKPLPTYATVFGDEETQQAISAGHSAVKLHVERFGARPEPSAIAELAAQVRQVLGSEAPLMLDAFGRWDVPTTLAVAEALVPYDVGWIEEPLMPNDYQGYQQLAAESPIPIAGGEHEYLAEGFAHLIDHGLHKVFQPDVNWCGGLTTLIEIYRLAQAAGLRVCPHRGCEPFALPAIAALDRQPLAESPRPWFTCLQGTPQIKDGAIRLSSDPGFGISVDQSLWQGS